jgi:hypothetical protein
MSEKDFGIVIKGHYLEYYDDDHVYLVDGVIVPSVSEILATRFGGKYSGVDKAVLRRAADAGTTVHEAIEHFCKTGEISDEIPEVRNFIWLQKQYGFTVVANELPVLLSKDGEPVAAGRLDLVLGIDGKLGIGDIKRTSALDKEYVAYQTNIYRIAFMQSYDMDITFLRALHLRENVRKFVTLPVQPQFAIDLINEFLERRENE